MKESQVLLTEGQLFFSRECVIWILRQTNRKSHIAPNISRELHFSSPHLLNDQLEISEKIFLKGRNPFKI